MGMPFDDTDGPDWRPESVIDGVLHGSDVRDEMDSFYLDPATEYTTPNWDQGDLQTIREEYKRLSEDDPETFPPEKLALFQVKDRGRKEG